MSKQDESAKHVISAAEKERLEKEIAKLEERRIRLMSQLGDTAGDYKENVAFQDLDAEIRHTISLINMYRQTVSTSDVGTPEHHQHLYLNQRLVVTMPPSKEEITYEIVPIENVDPNIGKISPTSPFSVAIRDKIPGQEFEIKLGGTKTKGGSKVRYKFERIE